MMWNGIKPISSPSLTLQVILILQLRNTLTGFEITFFFKTKLILWSKHYIKNDRETLVGNYIACTHLTLTLFIPLWSTLKSMAYIKVCNFCEKLKWMCNTHCTHCTDLLIYWQQIFHLPACSNAQFCSFYLSPCSYCSEEMFPEMTQI